MANSILSNLGASQALQALNAASSNLQKTDTVMATGLAVAGAKDDAASYNIAQSLRSQTSGWQAVSASLGRAQSAVDVAASGAQQISDLLNQLDAKAVAYADPSLSDTDRQAVQADAQALIAQIDQVSGDSSFDGVGLLMGQGVPQLTINNVDQVTVTSTSPLTPRSFSTLTNASASDTSNSESMSSTTSYGLPYSPLTPASFATALPEMDSVSGGTFVDPDRTNASGSEAVRLATLPSDLVSNPAPASVTLDSYTAPATFQVTQDGAVLSRTSGAPTSGRQSLSYAYNPSGGPVQVTSSASGTWSVLGAGAGSPSVTTVSTGQGAAGDGAPLTLETSGSTPTKGVATYTVDGGTAAGRVDMLFDASLGPDTAEIYQNGVRVAATGQPYNPGGRTAGPPAAVTGPSVLSFDYDPSKGSNLTFAFNKATAQSSAGWTVGGLTLAPNGSPLPPASATTSTEETTSYNVDGAGIDDATLSAPLSPETGNTNTAAKTFTLAGGTTPGQVTLNIDTYDAPDTVQVFQGAVRVAASGQPTASGGAAVAAGAPGPGGPAGRVAGGAAHGPPPPGHVAPIDPTSADGWTVNSMTLQAAGDPAPSASTYPGSTQQIALVPYTLIKSPDGAKLSVESRNLTSFGLGLAGMDWADPSSVLQAVQSAMGAANAAAQYFGEQDQLVSGLLSRSSQRQDTLATGVGDLVDGDIAAASATQQADQVKQQIATQALSIANAGPSSLLTLFNR